MDYDSPWKEAMDRYFEWFMRFFFPRQHALIDWRRDSESLDSELRKLAPARRPELTPTSQRLRWKAPCPIHAIEEQD